MTIPSFDLITRPWVRVRAQTGEVTELSLSEVFARAHLCTGLAGELPTQDVAILRLLLGILRRAHLEARKPADWRVLWDRGDFDLEPIDAYLGRHSHRFDLVHEEMPFYQVADLRTAKGHLTELARLIPDVPAGHQYFTTRAAAHLKSMSFPEAARWIVHCQAYDPSGIKSGAVGDDRTSGGRGYPIGVAWCGQLGTAVLEGASLFETLLLNCPLGGERGDPELDLPVWERPPQGAAPEGRVWPTGPVDLLTWQSRRVRLGHDGDRATGVLICNGDPLHPRDLYHHEWMTSWRYSEPQTKAQGTGERVFMPRGHQPDRAVWRGLESLLAESRDRDAESVSKPGRWLTWLAELDEADCLPEALPVRVRAVAMHYGSQNSVIDDVTDDVLAVSVEVLADQRLRALAVDAVRDAESAVRCLAAFGAELAEAAGSSGEGIDNARSRARELGYGVLDVPYRRWLRVLRADSDRDQVRAAWQAHARDALVQLSRGLLRQAGNAAWIGRQVTRGPDRTVHLDAALAELGLYRRLHEALPLTNPAPAVKGATL